MARKALQRNEILADRKVESEVVIETGNMQSPEFILHFPQQPPRIVTTIADLLKQVGEYLKTKH